MARMIQKYPLNASSIPQPIDMPRRARVLYVAFGEGGPWLFAEVYEDADTKAFDVRNVRHFVVVASGGYVPEGAAYVGSCGLKLSRRDMVDYHVYETRPGRTTPL